ncbi:hypothetical protein [Aminipila sp.]|uniref:hypothetical protein n=1 Tax=Aminipila sp. TaxID=2060095 RepID=UPI00289E4E8A|nr:hypothetical protein [Aminipila sp.]
MIRTSISIVVLLAILVGAIFLQIFLSRRKNKWLGLVLPVICLGYSILMVLSIEAYAATSSGEIFIMFISTFLIANIPTAILIVIYIACREKFKPDKEMEKMKIRDL